MSTVEISQLCEGLSLADEDEAVREIAEEDIQDGAEDVDKCLVGRVLLGKKVNRDAFKGLIVQIWSPFGQVEVELVGENTFMFYFINKEDRNRVWLRGPWHFGNSMIVLEKPEGPRNISKLSFNRADIWVQIHDIPIMCMNRRTARWLAEQIGEVVEIPSESRECWGKYMRVKNWSRKSALEGLPLKFGSWLKATIPEKSQYRSISQTFGSSSERGKYLEGSREIEVDGSNIKRSGSMAPQKSESGNLLEAVITKGKKIHQVNLVTVGNRPFKVDEMCVDGPGSGYTSDPKVLCLPNSEPISGPTMSYEIQMDPDPTSIQIGEGPSMIDISPTVELVEVPKQQVASNNLVTPTKKTSKKWKRAAREGHQRQITGKIASPLNRMLNVSKAIKKNSIGSNSSTSSVKGIKEENLGCKRKDVFDLCMEETRDQKKGLSWNVRGLGNPRTFAALSKLLKTHSSKIVFLSETKLSGRKTVNFRKLVGYSGCFRVDSNGNSGGLMLLWKDSVVVSILSSSGHIDAHIRMEDGFL
ncbi:hypothetical protein EZV62_001857 [Acer yangbiense]|uniref:Uncharacterized protein n=1 Tax=Acer yangbiense TaxID=1000413 RepID=A0A5C7IW18_9ROSI|nr:hypothetical protein EZV62_001857 [Acer yangbiense]